MLENLPHWLKILFLRTIITFVLLNIALNALVFNYAYQNGARLPFEGVDFSFLLQVIISIIVAALSLVSLLVRMIPDFPEGMLKHFSAEDEISTSAQTPLSPKVLGIVVPLVMFGFIAGILSIPISHYINETLAVVLAVFAVFSYVPMFIAIIFSWWMRGAGKLYSIAIFLVGFIAMCWFIPPNFSKYLAMVKYGGGVDVQVTVYGFESTETYEGQLFLMTKRNIILTGVDCPQFVRAPCFTEIERNPNTKVVYAARLFKEP